MIRGKTAARTRHRQKGGSGKLSRVPVEGLTRDRHQLRNFSRVLGKKLRSESAEEGLQPWDRHQLRNFSRVSVKKLRSESAAEGLQPRDRNQLRNFSCGGALGERTF